MLGSTLGVIHSMGLDKCTMTCIHYDSIIQSIFTAPKILCASPVRLSQHLKPLSTTVFFFFFYCCHSLPFPECHILGIIQYLSFSYWLHSLSNTFVPPGLFCGLIVHFFLAPLQLTLHILGFSICELN